MQPPARAPRLLLQLLLVHLLLLHQGQTSSSSSSSSSSHSSECSVQPPSRIVCPSGVSSIDAPSSGLSGVAAVTFVEASTGSPIPQQRQQQLTLDSVNVSSNPNLTGVAIVSAVRLLWIRGLDVSGTSVLLGLGRVAWLLNSDNSETSRWGSVRIDHLLATSPPPRPPPSPPPRLDFGGFTELLYSLRVRRFRLAGGWRLANFRADFARAGNRCASKGFDAAAVADCSLAADVADALNGDGGRLEVGAELDLSGNGLVSVRRLDIHAGRVDLSRNRLVRMPGVRFLPGAVCGTAVTGPPELLLSRNRLGFCALRDFIAGQRSGGPLGGLDLSGNPHLLDGGGCNGSNFDNASFVNQEVLVVSDFLTLANVTGGRPGRESRLAELLTMFRTPPPLPPPESPRLRLDLSSNAIDASVGGIFDAISVGVGDGLSELVLADNPMSGGLLDLRRVRRAAPLLRRLDIRRTPGLTSLKAAWTPPSSEGSPPPQRLGDLLAALWSPSIAPTLQTDADLADGASSIPCRWLPDSGGVVVCRLPLSGGSTEAASASATSAATVGQRTLVASASASVAAIACSIVLVVVGVVGCCFGMAAARRRARRQGVYQVTARDDEAAGRPGGDAAGGDSERTRL